MISAFRHEGHSHVYILLHFGFLAFFALQISILANVQFQDPKMCLETNVDYDFLSAVFVTVNRRNHRRNYLLLLNFFIICLAFLCCVCCLLPAANCCLLMFMDAFKCAKMILMNM